jgi:hypothetical protein
MADDLFSTPSALPAGGLKIADLEGSLVIIKPGPEEVEMVTTLGDATARPAQVLVLDGEHADPKEWAEILLFGAGLKAQAGGAVRAGKPIVGVVGKGEAKPGKTAPWLIKDPTTAQLEVARKAYLATTLPF